jgi:hypothetical protein
MRAVVCLRVAIVAMVLCPQVPVNHPSRCFGSLENGVSELSGLVLFEPLSNDHVA